MTSSGTSVAQQLVALDRHLEVVDPADRAEVRLHVATLDPVGEGDPSRGREGGGEPHQKEGAQAQRVDAQEAEDQRSEARMRPKAQALAEQIEDQGPQKEQGKCGGVGRGPKKEGRNGEQPASQPARESVRSWAGHAARD
jgi:hypothetical protein